MPKKKKKKKKEKVRLPYQILSKPENKARTTITHSGPTREQDQGLHITFVLPDIWKMEKENRIRNLGLLYK